MAKQPRGTSQRVDGLIVAGADGGGASVSSGDTGGSAPIASPDNGGLIIVDPASIGDDAGSGAGSAGDNPGVGERKRRGRKPGSGKAKSGPSLDINGVEAILFSAHTILATITKTQELALDKAESEQMAQALANVSRHYDIEATQKSMDWANLLMCMGMIYGTRIYAIRARRQSQPKPAPRSTANGSADIPGVGAAIFEPGVFPN